MSTPSGPIAISPEQQEQIDDLKRRFEELRQHRDSLIKTIRAEHLQSSYDDFMAEWEKNGPSQEARRLCGALNIAMNGSDMLIYEQIGY